MRGLRRVLVLSLTFLNVKVCGLVLGAIALTLLCQSSGPLLKIKVLGGFLGNGFMDDSNWLPRIEAVEKCLNSWHSRTLSYSGKAIVSIALTLSRVWYVASLFPIPPWALLQLNSLVFKFFWSGKRDLVARNVFHSPENGGFSVVSIAFKVLSLLVQWIKQFASSLSGWVGLMTYWFLFYFNASPLEVFSDPFSFDPDYLPVEAGDIGICLALSPFGRILEVTHQHFAGFKNITTGTHIVRVSLQQHIPFHCNIQGYPCHLLYSGQPLKCTICNGMRKAADCPNKNKC